VLMGTQQCDVYMNGKHWNETQGWRWDYGQGQAKLLGNLGSCVEVMRVNAETWKWLRTSWRLSANVT